MFAGCNVPTVETDGRCIGLAIVGPCYSPPSKTDSVYTIDMKTQNQYPALTKGSELPSGLQRQVLASYCHRFTREHVPAWAKRPMNDGKPYPIQFDSDQDWLNNTYFKTTRYGGLDARSKHCDSTPTWPDNPELRK
jgi:hypothetical protein